MLLVVDMENMRQGIVSSRNQAEDNEAKRKNNPKKSLKKPKKRVAQSMAKSSMRTSETSSKGTVFEGCTFSKNNFSFLIQFVIQVCYRNFKWYT